MVGVTTIALLERKSGMPRDLFTRYWRDVHGVMAARIPGFSSYVQHHVTPLREIGSDVVEPFEGIAVVHFADEADRLGLIHGEVTPYIHRDERNVFRRALLYNLGRGESRSLGAASDGDGPNWFLVVPQGGDGEAVAHDLQAAGAQRLDLFDLRTADPGGWNDTDVAEGGLRRLFAFVIQVWWDDADKAIGAIRDTVAKRGGQVAAFRTDLRFAMVENGRPTQIGLRGLDAVRTIEEAGATNQLEPDVVRAVYGAIAGPERKCNSTMS